MDEIDDIYDYEHVPMREVARYEMHPQGTKARIELYKNALREIAMGRIINDGGHYETIARMAKIARDAIKGGDVP